MYLFWHRMPFMQQYPLLVKRLPDYRSYFPTDLFIYFTLSIFRYKNNMIFAIPTAIHAGTVEPSQVASTELVVNYF